MQREAKHTVRIPISRVSPSETTDKTVSFEVELPSYIQKITGISIDSNGHNDLVYFRGSSCFLTICGVELIADGEPVTEYMFGINNPVRAWKFGDLQVAGTNRRLNFRYTDSPVTGYDFPAAGYSVMVKLTYERKD